MKKFIAGIALAAALVVPAFALGAHASNQAQIEPPGGTTTTTTVAQIEPPGGAAPAPVTTAQIEPPGSPTPTTTV